MLLWTGDFSSKEIAEVRAEPGNHYRANESQNKLTHGDTVIIRNRTGH